VLGSDGDGLLPVPVPPGRACRASLVGLCNSPRFFAHQARRCRSRPEAALSTVLRETIAIHLPWSCAQRLQGKACGTRLQPGALRFASPAASQRFLPWRRLCSVPLLRPDHRRLHHRQLLIIRLPACLPARLLPARPYAASLCFCCASALRRLLRSPHLAALAVCRVPLRTGALAWVRPVLVSVGRR
jgi:hypothetical protein